MGRVLGFVKHLVRIMAHGRTCTEILVVATRYNISGFQLGLQSSLYRAEISVACCRPYVPRQRLVGPHRDRRSGTCLSQAHT